MIVISIFLGKENIKINKSLKLCFFVHLTTRYTLKNSKLTKESSNAQGQL